MPGLIVKVATNNFEMQLAVVIENLITEPLLIPVKMQTEMRETVAVNVNALAEKYRLKIYAVAIR